MSLISVYETLDWSFQTAVSENIFSVFEAGYAFLIGHLNPPLFFIVKFNELFGRVPGLAAKLTALVPATVATPP